MITYATLAIQCTPEKGKQPGDFLYQGKHWWGSGNGEGFKIVSPVFGDLIAFYTWQKESGWQPMPYDPAAPTGQYYKESDQ